MFVWVLKESNKNRCDGFCVRNSVLSISHVTFRDCRVEIFTNNLSWNSCIRNYKKLFSSAKASCGCSFIGGILPWKKIEGFYFVCKCEAMFSTEQLKISKCTWMKCLLETSPTTITETMGNFCPNRTSTRQTSLLFYQRWKQKLALSQFNWRHQSLMKIYDLEFLHKRVYIEGKIPPC